MGHGVDIHLTTGLSHELEQAVFHRQLDAAIVTEPGTPREDLEFCPFVDESLVVITHRDTARGTEQQVLEDTPYIRFNRSARVGNMIQQEIVRRHISVRAVMEIDTLEGVVAMVANGLGSSVIPTRQVEGEFPPSIRTIPFGSPPLTRRLGVLIPRDNPRAHLSRFLLESLRAVSNGPPHTLPSP
jgi:DNA-binding transcriptional LysR family regulator